METVFAYSIMAFMYITVGLIVAGVCDAVIRALRSTKPRNRRLTDAEKQERMHDAIRKSGGEWFDV